MVNCKTEYIPGLIKSILLDRIMIYSKFVSFVNSLSCVRIVPIVYSSNSLGNCFNRFRDLS